MDQSAVLAKTNQRPQIINKDKKVCVWCVCAMLSIYVCAAPSLTCRMSRGRLLLINEPVGSPMVARFQTKFGHCWLAGSGANIREGWPHSSISWTPLHLSTRSIWNRPRQGISELSKRTVQLVIFININVPEIFNKHLAILSSCNLESTWRVFNELLFPFKINKQIIQNFLSNCWQFWL